MAAYFDFLQTQPAQYFAAKYIWIVFFRYPWYWATTNNDDTLKIQEFEDDYESAYFLKPVKGLYKSFTFVDSRSLHPCLIIAYNIYPSTHTYDTYTFSHIPKVTLLK